MIELTDRQHLVMTTILDLAAKNGELPTIREIGMAMDFSGPNAVIGHLRLLAAKGCLKYEMGERSGYTLPKISRAVSKAAKRMLAEFGPRLAHGQEKESSASG